MLCCNQRLCGITPVAPFWCLSSPPPLIFFKGKPDLNTSLPVRQTASIFKQPVTKVTNHPNNKVKTDPQKAVDQPRQVRHARLSPLSSPIKTHYLITSVSEQDEPDFSMSIAHLFDLCLVSLCRALLKPPVADDTVNIVCAAILGEEAERPQCLRHRGGAGENNGAAKGSARYCAS